jgi:type IV pilus biogenesis protein PilP
MSANRQRVCIALCFLVGLPAALTMPAHAKEASQAASAKPAGPAPSRASAASSLAAASAAAPAPQPVPSAAADELTRLQDQTVVLQAKLKELEAQQAVDARLQALRGTPAAPSVGNIRVVAVEGMGTTRIATVRLSDGSEFEAAPGDTIVDGIRVAAIERGAVTVRLRNGRLMRLRVGASDGETGTALGETQASPANTLGDVTLAPRFQGRAE